MTRNRPPSRSGQPLAGIRVLDMSRVLAGPWAAQLLADLGAEVIKIERPGVGDETRHWGPPFFELDNGESVAAYFLAANRGKRSVAIDLKTAAGQTLIRKLAIESDVLIENFKAGCLERFDLDYASLKEVNPGLVYCSITGFGQTGPYRDMPGYDILIQGMAGLMSVTGMPLEDNGVPTKVGVAVTDLFTGLYAVAGIQAALYERKSSGIGQYIDIALFDVQVAALANQALNFLVSHESPERLGNAHPNIVPYQPFETADGFVIVAVGNDEQFRRYAAVAGMPELAVDERYSSNPRRVENRESLVTTLSGVMKQRTTKEWVEDLQSRKVPCGPVNDIEQAFAEAQTKARGLETALESPHGSIPSVRCPLQFAAGGQLAPPMLGADTGTVLETLLGLSARQLDVYEEQGAIFRAAPRSGSLERDADAET